MGKEQSKWNNVAALLWVSHEKESEEEAIVSRCGLSLNKQWPNDCRSVLLLFLSPKSLRPCNLFCWILPER